MRSSDRGGRALDGNEVKRYGVELMKERSSSQPSKSELKRRPTKLTVMKA